MRSVNPIGIPSAKRIKGRSICDSKQNDPCKPIFLALYLTHPSSIIADNLIGPPNPASQALEIHIDLLTALSSPRTSAEKKSDGLFCSGAGGVGLPFPFISSITQGVTLV